MNFEWSPYKVGFQAGSKVQADVENAPYVTWEEYQRVCRQNDFLQGEVDFLQGEVDFLRDQLRLAVSSRAEAGAHGASTGDLTSFRHSRPELPPRAGGSPQSTAVKR